MLVYNSTSGTWVPTAAPNSGTYTPTLTGVTNVAAATAFTCQWMRVGNVVTVSGRVMIDPTAAGLLQLGFSVPIASNFSALEQAGGMAGSNDATNEEALRVYADATNDRVEFAGIINALTGNSGYHFSFTYLVV